MPVEEAIQQLQSIIDPLPKVANAQQRLLGIQMGADVRALDARIGAASGSVTGGAQQPENWIPSVGEQVVVRGTVFALQIHAF
jgi:hypothetical protein